MATPSSKHFLIVGSFLRPQELLKYKNEIERRDDIQYPFYNDLAGYKEVEDKMVAHVVEEQVKRNLAEVTDGEFSRSLWHLDFIWGLKGVRRYIAEHGYFFRDLDDKDQIDREAKFETRRDIGIDFTQPICCEHHAFIDHYRRLEKLANGKEIKECIPSPAHIYGEFALDSKNKGIGGKIYPTKEALKDDLLQAYKDFLDEYKAAGGKIIQLDDCLWELFASDNQHSVFGGNGHSADEVQELANEFVSLNNAVADYAHELGLKVYTHNCRGNYRSRSMADGSYETISDLFLKNQRYDRFYLEWDDERAGDLSALKAFADRPDVEVVLGLLSSKTQGLDDEERVKKLLQEATQYIPKERLFLSHQCGFASCDNGNALSEAQQWAKVEQGQRVAFEFWGE